MIAHLMRSEGRQLRPYWERQAHLKIVDKSPVHQSSHVIAICNCMLHLPNHSRILVDGLMHRIL